MTGIVVVPFDAAHAPSLARLYLAARRATFHWAPADRFALHDFAPDTDGEVIEVALHDGEPVGFVSVWMPAHFIHHLYVDAAYQGLGIGTLLLDRALQRIGRPAGLKCVERNARALAFYRAKGWRFVAHGEDDLGRHHLLAFDAVTPP
jgi:GNAT superfamily N-acetyltransferase